MKRYLCWLTLLGVLAIPDWASACYVRQWFAPPCQPMPPICCDQPMYSGPPVVYMPVYVTPQAAPRIQQVIPQAMSERETPISNVPPVRTRPKSEPVRPAAAVVNENQIPTPMPMPMKEQNNVVIPPLSPMLPKVDANPLKLPDANPLKLPDVNPLKLPDAPLTLPGTNNATPTPAPAPDSSSLIPPMFPKLPESPTLKLTTPNTDALPPLVLPPEAKGSTSKSSPLADRGDGKVQVLVAEGKPAFGPTRRVCFFNHSDRDIELVIEGRSVSLPKRTYINAELAPTFRWKQHGEETRTESIPDGSAGLDVVFRE